MSAKPNHRDNPEVMRIAGPASLIDKILNRMDPEDRAIALQVLTERYDVETGVRR